jgi:hypothetical protein
MLNDQLRRHLTGGRAVMTPGIAALGSEAVQRLVETISTFDDFCTPRGFDCRVKRINEQAFRLNERLIIFSLL